MTEDELLQKYDELCGQKEDPKSFPSPRCSKDACAWAIRHLEELLEELKTGKAILTDSKTEPTAMMMPLRIDEGDKITLTIFRKYR